MKMKKLIIIGSHTDDFEYSFAGYIGVEYPSIVMFKYDFNVVYHETVKAGKDSFTLGGMKFTMSNICKPAEGENIEINMCELDNLFEIIKQNDTEEISYTHIRL